MNNPKEILLKILEIIGYTDDRNLFTEEYIKIIQLQGIADLIQSLEDEQQTQIKKQLSVHAKNFDKIQEILQAYFSSRQLKEALENASKTTMENYIRSIDTSLSQEQRKNLISLFRQISPDVQAN
jgi:hypothetical protein